MLVVLHVPNRLRARLTGKPSSGIPALQVQCIRLLSAVYRYCGGGPAELAEPLTRRELDVLQMAASGLTNRAIGGRLDISDRTMQGHLRCYPSPPAPNGLLTHRVYGG